jgi:hypothetical protein
MATDGTGLKVIIPELPAAHNGYVELYRNDEVAVFQYEATKDGESVAAKLKPFRGTLTADAEHRFNDVFASGSVLEADCNAHGRRKFEDAEATQPPGPEERRPRRGRAPQEPSGTALATPQVSRDFASQRRETKR